MTFKIKHIGLTLGLISVLVSFLFFGRQQGTYQILLIGGLIISLVFYLTILFSKGTYKTKLIWTLVIILSVFIQWSTESILIKKSYLIYLKSNNKELTEVNEILLNKQGEISIYYDTIDDKFGILTTREIDNLRRLKEKLNVYIITKAEDGIYYGLWGFLDVRIGIIYWTKNEKPNNSYYPLTENWYSCTTMN